MISVRSCTTTTTTESQAEYQEDENNKDSQPSLRFAQEQVEQQQSKSKMHQNENSPTQQTLPQKQNDDTGPIEQIQSNPFLLGLVVNIVIVTIQPEYE